MSEQNLEELPIVRQHIIRMMDEVLELVEDNEPNGVSIVTYCNDLENLIGDKMSKVKLIQTDEDALEKFGGIQDVLFQLKRAKDSIENALHIYQVFFGDTRKPTADIVDGKVVDIKY